MVAKSEVKALQLASREFFVHLLGHEETYLGFFLLLELGDERLDQWLEKGFNGEKDFKELAWSLFSGLAQLHRRGLAHLDVKPENVMRFKGRWKLIDLECCLPLDESHVVSMRDITPLYASPEVASAILSGTAIRPSAAMDIWAAGVTCPRGLSPSFTHFRVQLASHSLPRSMHVVLQVVLLDVLVGGSYLGDTKAGCDLAALLDGETMPNEAWFRWLSESALALPSCAWCVDGGLQGFLRLIVARQPLERASAETLRRHEPPGENEGRRRATGIAHREPGMGGA